MFLKQILAIAEKTVRVCWQQTHRGGRGIGRDRDRGKGYRDRGKRYRGTGRQGSYTEEQGDRGVIYRRIGRQGSYTEEQGGKGVIERDRETAVIQRRRETEEYGGREVIKG